MKVCIGIKPRQGPYGGSNQFCHQLEAYLKARGADVVYGLNDPDIDIILIVDPRHYLDQRSFRIDEAVAYVRKVNPKALIVHRVNECDRRKGTWLMDPQLALTNSVADHTVFISPWLQKYFAGSFPKGGRLSTVIHNGADQDVFHYCRRHLPQDRKIRLITHHFGPSLMKGWDIYLWLDNQLDDPNFSARYELHYVGNVPKGVKVRNMVLHEPCSGDQLAQVLGQADIYLSASLFEPAGMHHIEGALCGLPLVYRDSGALPDYCRDFGVMFRDTSDVMAAIVAVTVQYERYAERLVAYPFTGQFMCQNFFQLFNDLISRREAGSLSRPWGHGSFLWEKYIYVMFSLCGLAHKFRIR